MRTSILFLLVSIICLCLAEVRIRKNVESLTEEEWNELADAFRKMGVLKKRRDSKYQVISNYHGEPNRWCHFNEDGDMDETRFLSWHRAYTLQFENFMMEASGKKITLPYFDCASDASYYSNDLHPKLNARPFNSAWIALIDRYSMREPGSEDLNLQSCRKRLRNTFRERFDSTLDFQESLRKGIHNFLHLWIGNDMGDLSFASFDPIFWFHHANIDRLWAIWQKNEGRSVQRREFENNEEFLDWDFSNRGFDGLKYRDFMDNTRLPSLSNKRGTISVVYEDEKNLYTSSSKRTESIATEFSQSDLSISLKNLAPTSDSYILRASYKSENQSHHLGTFSILGYGKCCKNDICSNLSKKNQTFDSSIDISDSWQDIKDRDTLSISLSIYNLSKKKYTTFDELQHIFKRTVKDVKDMEFTWEQSISSRSKAKNENKYPQIVFEK